MDVEFLIERLEHYILEESPKFFGVRAVNEAEVRNHLTQLQEAIPDEIQQARKVLLEREAILDAARDEAQRIIAAAQVKAEQLAAEHRLVQEARQQPKPLPAAPNMTPRHCAPMLMSTPSTP